MHAPSTAVAAFVCGALIALSPLTAQTAGTPTTPAASPSAPAAAPAPAELDLFVADLVRPQALRSTERWQIERARNVTKRDGYDNQPFYLPDGQRLLYTSARGEQTDVYELDLARATERPVTSTPESEFSPQPSADRSSVVVVRVEPDGTQRLWSFPLGGTAPAVIAPEVKGIGYHAWLDATTVAVFVLGDPFTLQLVDLGTGTARTVAERIGRSIHRVPGSRGRGSVSFTAPDGESRAIFVYDAATNATRKVAPAPPTEEGDYAWTPDGALVAAVGSTIHRLRPGVDPDWVPVADLAGDGVGRISRIAVSPMGNQIAFVAER